MEFNIYLGIYIVVCLAIAAGGTKKLYDMNQSICAIFFFIGVAIVCYLYGLRWFGTESAIFSNTPVKWPPIINTCPDYLTYYKRTKADGTIQDTCIDLVGISKKCTSSALRPFPKDATTPPTDDFYYFDLTTNGKDEASKYKDYCNKANNAGVTWEGIYNGEGCVSPAGITAPS